VPTRKSAKPKKARGAEKRSARPPDVTKKRSAAPGKKKKEELDPAAQRFVRDLLIRGEAARPTPDGDLPPGATHRIVEEDEEGGLPTVERERFSIS
jgi:hypothetical protein